MIAVHPCGVFMQDHLPRYESLSQADFSGLGSQPGDFRRMGVSGILDFDL